MTDSIALLCMLYPDSPEKQERCLSLLRKAAREYYRLPSAECTAWSYFTPFPPPKKSNSKPLVIGGLEMYTTKSALQAQVQDPVFFQSYHETVKREELYAKPEVLEAWFSTGGFVVRDSVVRGSGNGVLISVTRMICSEGKKGTAMEVMRPFAEWVHANEPDVLTYALFTRPKAPNELILFVRYKDVAALKGHSNAPEHVAILKELSSFLDKGVDQSTTLWKEVEDSFVSDVVGGGSREATKL